MEVPNNRYAVPTSAKELAKVVAQFIDSDEYGIYHAVCKGSCSRYEFAKEILNLAGKSGEMEIVPVITEDDSRPAYSVLDNMMLRISGMEEPKEWKEALKEYIEETGGIE
jgi:dTDP-4-dehydrorhamnose reductase